MPTRLGAPPEMARCVWAYPLVGAVVGAMTGAAYAVAAYLGIPPTLAACWAIAASLAITGALHEDGLADTADGFGGGRTRERKLEIMRDSRIGTYGALALMLALGIRVTALTALADPWVVAPALIAAGALGRGAIVGLLAILNPARPDGLAAQLGQVPAGQVRTGLLLAAAAAFVLPLGLAGLSVWVAGMTCIAVAMVARLQVGGYTGDVLGAGAVVTECVVLTIVAANLG